MQTQKPPGSGQAPAMTSTKHRPPIHPENDKNSNRKNLGARRSISGARFENKRAGGVVKPAKSRSLCDDYQLENYDSGKVIVATGRLPVRVDWEKKTLTFAEGGVNRALRTLKGVELVGYVDGPINARGWIKDKLRKLSWHPVFLSREVRDVFYEDFSNNLLYSVFHYMPLPMKRTETVQDGFACYESANRSVTDAILEIWRPGDVVWVHDYHLLLLPKLLRKVKPRMRIGYFLHIPFPSSEIYRTLPVRSQLLNGVLGADLIGFQIHEYARHFESACVRVLGVHANDGRITRGNDNSRIMTCPIGIDPDRFIKALNTPKVKDIVEQLEIDYKGRKVLLGFDRFDHIKGIPHKLYAMERFLEEHPEWIGKVVMLQIASAWSKKAPKSDEYKDLVRQTHEIVGRINGRFGTLSSMPIHYLQKSVSFEELVALYRVADALVISSTRDGMNLVAHEYVTCQTEKHGILILSEFTGAAKSLGAGSLQVNPWNVQSFGNTLRYALEMSPAERERLHKYAYRYVQEHTTKHWATTFLSKLRGLSVTHVEKKYLGSPQRLSINAVATQFRMARHRVIITGFTGTLTPHGTQHKKNLQRAPSSQGKLRRITEKMKRNIYRIAQDPNTTVIVVSNATRDQLMENFGNSDVWLAAENGFFLRKGRDDPHWHYMYDSIDLSWKARVRKVFQYFTDRTPQTFICEHDTTCSWHYHDAQRGFADKQANDLMIHLRGGILSNTSTEIQDTSAVIQIRPVGLSKGASMHKIWNHYDKIAKNRSKDSKNPSPKNSSDYQLGRVDFLMCVGSFTKLDDDVFDFVNNHSRRRKSSQTHSTSQWLPKSKRSQKTKGGVPGLSARSVTAPFVSTEELNLKEHFDSTRDNKANRTSTNGESSPNSESTISSPRPDVSQGSIGSRISSLSNDGSPTNLSDVSLISCAVGNKRGTHARHYVKDDKEVEQLLTLLSQFCADKKDFQRPRPRIYPKHKPGKDSKSDKRESQWRLGNVGIGKTFRPGRNKGQRFSNRGRGMRKGIFVKKADEDRQYLSRAQLSADSGFWYF
mmetsp:Transcript_2967/g.4370  ORF Transcript_2967/g.4370 Transcript_2967/m.4370 type:complete len:1045 (+) Transcript_2967:68-3202(+)